MSMTLKGTVKIMLGGGGVEKRQRKIVSGLAKAWLMPLKEMHSAWYLVIDNM